MQVSNKIEIFNVTKNIAIEIKANVQKTLNNISEYNIAEKKDYIKNILLKIESKIVNEINRRNKDIKINDNTLFLLNDIFEVLKIDNNGIKLTDMDISNLYSFKELNNDKEEKEKLKNDLNNIKEKLRTELDEIKLKSFKNILYRKNINPERFYEVNTFILNKCISEEITLILSKNVSDNKEGLYFIINKKDLIIRRKKENALIIYTIKFNELEEQFNININGKIRVNNTEEIFNIDETYPNSMRGSVLNVYNIRRIIELFNLLYTGYYSNNNKPIDNKDIDDYLSGRIKND